MTDQLTSLLAGSSKAQTINHIIQSALQDAQQVFTGLTGHALCHVKILQHLVFHYAIVAAGGLLGTQLGAILRNLLAGLAVLAGNRLSAAYSALVGVASVAL